MEELAHQRFTGELIRLTVSEQRLFQAIRDNELGENIRLEQTLAQLPSDGRVVHSALT